MNQHIQSVKNINGEKLVTTNNLSPQKNRYTYSVYASGLAIFMLLGLVAHSAMGEINFSVKVSSPVKQPITEKPQHQAQVKDVQAIYLKPVITESKNLRLCYDHPDENFFEC